MIPVGCATGIYERRGPVSAVWRKGVNQTCQPRESAGGSLFTGRWFSIGKSQADGIGRGSGWLLIPPPLHVICYLQRHKADIERLLFPQERTFGEGAREVRV
jgi:hypothetical protein